jgi:hypothetical protein
MSLKIRRLFEPRLTIGYAIEDPDTGHFYDFTTRTFDADPDHSIQDLVEDWIAKAQGNDTSLRFLRGAYANVDPGDRSIVQLDTPKGIFRVGLYTIYFIDRGDVDRAIKVETWVAEERGGTIDFRPQPDRQSRHRRRPHQAAPRDPGRGRHRPSRARPGAGDRRAGGGHRHGPRAWNADSRADADSHCNAHGTGTDADPAAAGASSHAGPDTNAGAGDDPARPDAAARHPQAGPAGEQARPPGRAAESAARPGPQGRKPAMTCGPVPGEAPPWPT